MPHAKLAEDLVPELVGGRKLTAPRLDDIVIDRVPLAVN